MLNKRITIARRKADTTIISSINNLFCDFLAYVIFL